MHTANMYMPLETEIRPIPTTDQKLAIWIATEICGAYLSPHPHGQSLEDRIAGMALLIASTIKRFKQSEAPEIPGYEAAPDSVVEEAWTSFLRENGPDMFCELLDGNFDVVKRRHDAAAAFNKEVASCVRRGNELAVAG